MTDNFNENDLQGFDEYEDDRIVFADENGNEIEFTEVAAFDYNGKEYSALTPVREDDEEEGPLDVIFCEVKYDEKDGFEVFDIVDDEALNEELFNYFITLDESLCGCDGCHDDDCDCCD